MHFCNAYYLVGEAGGDWAVHAGEGSSFGVASMGVSGCGFSDSEAGIGAPRRVLPWPGVDRQNRDREEGL